MAKLHTGPRKWNYAQTWKSNNVSSGLTRIGGSPKPGSAPKQYNKRQLYCSAHPGWAIKISTNARSDFQGFRHSWFCQRDWLGRLPWSSCLSIASNHHIYANAKAVHIANHSTRCTQIVYKNIRATGIIWQCSSWKRSRDHVQNYWTVPAWNFVNRTQPRVEGNCHRWQVERFLSNFMHDSKYTNSMVNDTTPKEKF